MGLPYDPHALEARWRLAWQEAGTGLADLDGADPERAYTNLVEFPYPSAEGLHVGHVFRYSGADAWGRYQRMRGRQVFQPIGFDAFGINAENYALRVGRHPAEVIGATTERFRAQLSRGGMAWDWRQTVDTSRPQYYRWTQWVFLRLLEAGLAYQAEAPVLWCGGCLTVLAREQTEGPAGAERCERCSTPVTERVLRQWFLRMTAYRERLLAGLEALDWPPRAKRLQRRWLENLHDWLISRQRYWGPPIPVVHCRACGVVGVPDEQLPVVLPDIDEVRPTGDGRSPLAAVPAFVHTCCPRCGGPARRETDVSDTFLDSAWYFLRYPSARVHDRPWDPQLTARWLPVGFYAGGVEHAQRHHLYARFVTMALHDLGLVPFEEPFPRLRLGGTIVHGGAKMSKSRGNVVSPDAYWEGVGSDVLRCALLFTAPWEDGGDFRDDAVAGVERFFGRAWRAVADRRPPGKEGGADLERVAREVTRAVERLSFNVALARLMELARVVEDDAGRRMLVLLLAPLAPHLAEELWHRLGGAFSVHDQPWPG